jgi:heme a synthase
MTQRNLIWMTVAFAFIVIGVGAYVRLEDAGLGCPDWPGCYGQLIGIPEAAHEKARAEEAFPDKALDAGRARKEMLHRYLAGTLGLLICAIAITAWRTRSTSRQSPALPFAIVVLVGLQAALGMWTVTLLLKPAIVMLHLLGGMLTLVLLVWLGLRFLQVKPPPARIARSLRPWTAAGMAILGLQIALGGWVSSNYAGLACPDFPTCHGAWMPPMDFHAGFNMVRELGVTADGVPLRHDALVAIHWSHRIGAVVTALLLGGLAIALLRAKNLRVFGMLLLVLLGGQIALGIANVAEKLPLGLAVAHNAGAALLLAALVVINFTVFKRPDETEST